MLFLNRFDDLRAVHQATAEYGSVCVCVRAWPCLDEHKSSSACIKKQGGGKVSNKLFLNAARIDSTLIFTRKLLAFVQHKMGTFP